MRYWRGLAKYANINLDIEIAPGSVPGHDRHPEFQRKRQTCAITQREPAVPCLRDETRSGNGSQMIKWLYCQPKQIYGGVSVLG